MFEACAPKRRRSKPVKDQSVPISKFGKCIAALEPVKPALWLAARVACSERHANRLINGERKPSARALVALMGEVA